jgi:hypothetical protein
MLRDVSSGVRYQDGVCVCVTPVEQGGGGRDSTADVNH